MRQHLTWRIYSSLQLHPLDREYCVAGIRLTYRYSFNSNHECPFFQYQISLLLYDATICLFLMRAFTDNLILMVCIIITTAVWYKYEKIEANSLRSVDFYSRSSRSFDPALFLALSKRSANVRTARGCARVGGIPQDLRHRSLDAQAPGRRVSSPTSIAPGRRRIRESP